MLPEILINNNKINDYTNKTNDITSKTTKKYLPTDQTEAQPHQPVVKNKLFFSIKDYKYNHYNNLIQQYINNDTQNFTDDDWLTLIIKLGKRRFNPAKFAKYEATYNKVGMQVFLTKIAELQPLRHELENAIAKTALKDRRYLSSNLQRKNKLFEIISKEQFKNIISRAKAFNPSREFNSELLCASEYNSIFEKHNPFFSWLIIASYRNNTFTPANFNKGMQLRRQINDNLTTKSPEEEQDLTFLLESTKYNKTICGGRTLQVTDNDNQCFYLKFQRKDENWDEFIKEQAMHLALLELNITDTLKSEIPVSKYLFKLPKKVLSYKFKDSLEIYHQNNDKYVYGYCFTASPNYVKYVGANDNEATEQGFKKAIADIAKLASYGVTFDSIIESQHGIHSSIGWSSIFFAKIKYYYSDIKNCDYYPSSIREWISKTQRSDISYSGLRDLGDCSYFNYYNTFFNKRDMCTHYPNNISQIVLYFGALLDNIIAIFVLYARGKRNATNYNFTNPKIVAEVQLFIEEILNTFLIEYFENNNTNVQSIIQLTDEDYAKWLKRSAQEIIYWTTIAPKLYSNWKIDNSSSNETIKTTYAPNYIVDILQTHSLNPELYPNELDDQWNYKNLHAFGKTEVSLGLTHGPNFPFKGIINGVSLIFTKILLLDFDNKNTTE
jgi:hypothetical protein